MQTQLMDLLALAGHSDDTLEGMAYELMSGAEPLPPPESLSIPRPEIWCQGFLQDES